MQSRLKFRQGPIDTWIMELRTYAIIVKDQDPLSRKAAVLMVKHRAAYLTYYSTMTRFRHNYLYGDHGICQSRPEGIFMCLNILLQCDFIIVYYVKNIILYFYILNFLTIKENFSFFHK